MKELYRERDRAALSHHQAILEAAGISTFIRNENVSATEVLIPVFCPALCVVNDEDYDAAVTLIRENLKEAAESPTEDQTCPQCGETNPGAFEICWNCGTDLPVPA
ncbi:DUF2007 domain-containing protein [Luteolibacter sp. Populi]|uniref:putative signal transducing protein n=1 Tax=Luteolibacter sp. Populi TaxID=3230487 RepID=UPI003466C174